MCNCTQRRRNWVHVSSLSRLFRVAVFRFLKFRSRCRYSIIVRRISLDSMELRLVNVATWSGGLRAVIHTHHEGTSHPSCLCSCLSLVSLSV